MNMTKLTVTCKSFNNALKCFSNSAPCPPKKPYKYIVTVMNGTSQMGQALSLMLKQNPYLQQLRIYDDKKDVLGIGMDLSDIDSSCKIVAYKGEKHLKAAVEDAHIVVSCGGHTSNPFDSYETVFERNVDDVRRTCIYLSELNRDCVYCIANPAVESLVPMAYQEYRKASVKFPECKIVGVANYTSMRANMAIGRIMEADPFQVACPILGGVSAETAVAAVSCSVPGCKLSNPHKLAVIQEKTAFGEEEVITEKLGKCNGSVAFAPAVGTYRLVNNVLKGLKGDGNAYDCAFVRQENHLKVYLPYMTSIVRFGLTGVADTYMPELVGGEIYYLKRARKILEAYIQLGESYVNSLPLSHEDRKCSTDGDVDNLKLEDESRN